MRGKVTVLKTDGTKEITEYDGLLPDRALQIAVAGYIALVPNWNTYQGEPAAVFCNEEGKLIELPYNEEATRLWHARFDFPVRDILVGNIAIVTGDKQFMEEL